MERGGNNLRIEGGSATTQARALHIFQRGHEKSYLGLVDASNGGQ